MLHAALLLTLATPAQAVKIGNSTYEAMDWTRIDGWVDDDDYMLLVSDNTLEVLSRAGVTRLNGVEL